MKLICRFCDSDVEHGLDRFSNTEHIVIIEHPTASECMDEFYNIAKEHNKNLFDYTPLEIVGVHD